MGGYRIGMACIGAREQVDMMVDVMSFTLVPIASLGASRDGRSMGIESNNVLVEGRYESFR